MPAPTNGSATIDTEHLTRLFERFATYDDVFLAVSGGPDSVALMHLAAAWRDHCRPPCRLHVLTVDHGLRPEAAGEAQAVAVAAHALGLPADVLTWAGPRPQSKVQESAREIRYRLLLARAEPTGTRAALVTAHHREDLAETVLMRLARGAGIDGLSAMRPMTCRGGVDILRPLLALTKATLAKVVADAGATSVEDPSNRNLDFERVRLRAAHAARVELNLTDEALALTAERAARARVALEGLTDQRLQPCRHSPILLNCGVFEWPWQPGTIPDDTAVRILMRVLPAVGGAVDRVRLLRVERLWQGMQRKGFTGATLGNCVLTPGQTAPWFIYREPARGALPRATLSASAPLIWDNRFEIRAAPEVGATEWSVRAFTRRDLKMLDCEAATQNLPFPLPALEATPVVEDVDGLLSIPALNVHRDATKAVHLSCRFLIERVLGKL